MFVQVLRVSMEEQRQRQEDEARRAHQLQGNSQATSGEGERWGGRTRREGTVEEIMNYSIKILLG